MIRVQEIGHVWLALEFLLPGEAPEANDFREARVAGESSNDLPVPRPLRVDRERVLQLCQFSLDTIKPAFDVLPCVWHA
jgi:hypothetical protein